MQKAIKPVQSLSALLKNIYVNGPGTHFPGSSHVLPIVILDQTIKSPSNEAGFSSESRAVLRQKLAFFF